MRIWQPLGYCNHCRHNKFTGKLMVSDLPRKNDLRPRLIGTQNEVKNDSMTRYWKMMALVRPHRVNHVPANAQREAVARPSPQHQ